MKESFDPVLQCRGASEYRIKQGFDEHLGLAVCFHAVVKYIWIAA
jgi:hypothetical protein